MPVPARWEGEARSYNRVVPESPETPVPDMSPVGIEGTALVYKVRMTMGLPQNWLWSLSSKLKGSASPE